MLHFSSASAGRPSPTVARWGSVNRFRWQWHVSNLPCGDLASLSVDVTALTPGFDVTEVQYLARGRPPTVSLSPPPWQRAWLTSWSAPSATDCWWTPSWVRRASQGQDCIWLGADEAASSRAVANVPAACCCRYQALKRGSLRAAPASPFQTGPGKSRALHVFAPGGCCSPACALLSA